MITTMVIQVFHLQWLHQPSGNPVPLCNSDENSNSDDNKTTATTGMTTMLLVVVVMMMILLLLQVLQLWRLRQPPGSQVSPRPTSQTLPSLQVYWPPHRRLPQQRQQQQRLRRCPVCRRCRQHGRGGRRALMSSPASSPTPAPTPTAPLYLSLATRVFPVCAFVDCGHVAWRGLTVFPGLLENATSEIERKKRRWKPPPPPTPAPDTPCPPHTTPLPPPTPSFCIWGGGGGGGGELSIM